MRLLFENKKKSTQRLSTFQKQRVDSLLNAINQNQLHLVNNNCLCGNEYIENDIIVATKDAFGIPIKSILCSKCSLIRAEKVFTETANTEFYKDYYRDIYNSGLSHINKYFEFQNKRGSNFFTIIEKSDCLKPINNIVEIGCGSGGVLYSFLQAGKSVRGFDFDKNYIEYGKSKGLNLIYGDYVDFINDKEVDLIICSHVIEHFLNPIQEVQNIVRKIRKGGYLMIEVPGIFFLQKEKIKIWNIFSYFQNAHVIQFFYEEYLKYFFETIGLEIIFSNERCTFLCQVPNDYEEKNVDSIYNNEMKKYVSKIETYIKQSQKAWKYRFLSPKYFIATLKRIIKNHI